MKKLWFTGHFLERCTYAVILNILWILLVWWSNFRKASDQFISAITFSWGQPKSPFWLGAMQNSIKHFVDISITTNEKNILVWWSKLRKTSNLFTSAITFHCGQPKFPFWFGDTQNYIKHFADFFITIQWKKNIKQVLGATSIKTGTLSGTSWCVKFLSNLKGWRH